MEQLLNLITGKTTGMSNAAGASDVNLDIEKDVDVIDARAQVASIKKSISDLQNSLVAANDELSSAQSSYQACLAIANNDPISVNKCNSNGSTRINAAKSLISKLNANLKKSQEIDLPSAQKNLSATLEAGQKKISDAIDLQVKLLAEKAKTDPVAADQVAKLNQQKLANDLALQQEKVSSSNKKIYVVAGVALFSVAVIATLWIVLTKQHVIRPV